MEMEPAVKWEYPSLGCANRNVCAIIRLLVIAGKTMSFAYGEVMVKVGGLFSGIVEVYHKSVALVNSNHVC